jgi:hypothetical protein
MLRAKARLHQALSDAHGSYAASLEALAQEAVSTGEATAKGNVQKRILRLPELGLLAGLTAPHISRKVGYDEANTYTVLKALTKQGALEQVEGTSPQAWRLSLKLRRNRVVRLSRLIRSREWTTYGEFAIAVYDNWRTAVVVGRQAAHNPAFANPHRVVGTNPSQPGGTIPEGWQDDEGQGPEECARRLRADEIPVTEAGGVYVVDPDKSFFVGWEELRRRLMTEEADEGL